MFLDEAQTIVKRADGTVLVNGSPKVAGGAQQLRPVGHVSRLPGDVEQTGPLGPLEFFSTLQQSEIVLWPSQTIREADGTVTTVYYPKPTPGSQILRPGEHPTFAGIRSERLFDKLNFISLMLALFCGTASLPHILIRYYTVKDEAAARKSTIVGIACIGFFYVLTLYMGLGAMTSGALDVTDSNMAAPLLARSFSELLFAIISAIAFTTVLGTVSGLILASAGAVTHDLLESSGAVHLERSRAGARGEDRLGRRGYHRDRAGHPVQGAERELPGRLGVQRGGQREFAGAGDAAVLARHDAAGHHRRGDRGHGQLAGVDSAERRNVCERLRPGERECAGAVQPAGDRDDPAGIRHAGGGVADDWCGPQAQNLTTSFEIAVVNSRDPTGRRLHQPGGANSNDAEQADGAMLHAR